MKIIKLIFKAIFQLVFASMLIYLATLMCLYYAFKIEPYRLNVEEVDLGNIQSDNSFTVVQFSDTHIKEDFTAENLSEVVDEINSLSADFVIFTGDLYDNYYTYRDDEAIIAELNRITANVAKIAIRGNRDYGGGVATKYDNIMINGGFTLMTNESLSFSTEDDMNILITAIDDSLMGNPAMPSANYENVDYSLFLSHEPDVVEDYPIENYDLILSGHTHGGQFDIPFLPIVNQYALNTSSLSSKYESGLTKLDVENNPYLYINTGIGTTRISARFMVVPEITEFTIYVD